MGQKKGNTGNRNGRPKGSKNKITTELRQWITNLITENKETLESDLKGLEPKDRWIIIEKLLNYTIPKMASIDSKIDFSQLDDQSLEIIINRLTEDI